MVNSRARRERDPASLSPHSAWQGWQRRIRRGLGFNENDLLAAWREVVIKESELIEAVEPTETRVQISGYRTQDASLSTERVEALPLPHTTPPHSPYMHRNHRSSTRERARRGIDFLENDLSTAAREVVFKESKLIKRAGRPPPAVQSHAYRSFEGLGRGKQATFHAPPCHVTLQRGETRPRSSIDAAISDKTTLAARQACLSSLPGSPPRSPHAPLSFGHFGPAGPAAAPDLSPD